MLLWLLFFVFVAGAIVLDLGVINRRGRVTTLREAFAWSGAWLTLSLLFCGAVFVRRGQEPALEFLAGYVIELSLSVDNLFIFLTIFGYFKVEQKHQHRALLFGVLGAMILRGIFVAAGAAVIRRFAWILYLFGAFLVFSGVRMARRKDHGVDPGRNPVLRLFRKAVPVTTEFADDRFLVRRQGALAATPLFVVLLMIETTDVVFAVDSVPAVFAVTLDPLIVYTSNIFAVLGMRSLYFALSGMVRRLRYLRYGLSAVLVFVGVKMLLHHVYRIPVLAALCTVLAILLVSVAASLVARRKTP